MTSNNFRSGSSAIRAARMAASLLCFMVCSFMAFSESVLPTPGKPGEQTSEVAAESGHWDRLDPRDIGSGELLWKGPGGLVPLPVMEMSVDLRVTGIMIRGTVLQSFANPTADVIDAIYVFPLPERAAVDSLEMRIGDRRIVSVIQERDQAKVTYEQAKREGKKAALLEQERPNLFTTSVANINPGETVVVSLEYLDEVSYADREFSLAFPLTFTPRYMPATHEPRTEPTGNSGSPENTQRSVPVSCARSDASRIAGLFLDAREQSVPRAKVSVRIDEGVPLEHVNSSSHPINVEMEGAAARVEARSPEGSSILTDRDFLLDWRVRSSEGPEGVLFIEDRDEGQYGLMMLLPPPADSDAGHGLPTETLFLVDVSGSMDGPSIVQARRALLAALGRLRPGDTFNILKFNDDNEPFRSSFQPVDAGSLAEAQEWVGALRASGGTEILPALLRGFEMMAAGDAVRAQRLILITDGAVGNEQEVLEQVSRRLGQAHLHIIGIGPAPNRYLMRKLAASGGGLCEFIDRVEQVEERMGSFLGRVDRPVMTDASLEWLGAPPLEVYPERLPDLYAGQPLFVSLKLGSAQPATRVLLRGRLRGGPGSSVLDITRSVPAGSGVATRWARAKVESLTDSLGEGADPALVRDRVVELAKAFRLVTNYTSLVAVEEIPTAEGTGKRMRVANGLPCGSRSLCDSLPQTGTSGPLLLLLGLSLALAGSLGAWLARLA